MIKKLSDFWVENNCAFIPGNISKVGAATLCEQTAFNVLGKKNWNICQLQYCLRPSDSRTINQGNRVGAYYQMQVILKPTPKNIQELCIKSFETLGLNLKEHDIRFLEDNWKNPSIGASGIGYEVWCDGMEICQFTYMQKIGGIDLILPVVELTYGMERLALYLQNKQNIFDLEWNENHAYKDFHPEEKESDFHFYNQFFQGDNEKLKEDFEIYLENSNKFLEDNKIYLAYSEALNASHTLNILDARGLLGKDQRQNMIFRIKNTVSLVLEKYSTS